MRFPRLSFLPTTGFLVVSLLAVCSHPAYTSPSAIWWKKLAEYPSEKVDAGPVVMDGSGKMIVVSSGYSGGSVDPDGYVYPKYNKTLRVDKFDADGNRIWLRAVAAGYSDLVGLDTAVDAQDDITITGYFDGDIDLGSGAVDNTGYRSAFLLKFDADGNYLWDRTFIGSDDVSAMTLVLTQDGGLVMAGAFSGTVDFGDGPVVGAGGEDAYIVRFDAAGSPVWTLTGGDSLDQAIIDIAIDNSGDITMLGRYEGTIDMVGGPATSNAGTSVFLARLDSNGGHVWSNGFTSTQTTDPQALVLDGGGNIIIAGRFNGSLNFGDKTITGPHQFVAKFAGDDGRTLWSRATPRRWDVVGLAVDESGLLFVGEGQFMDVLDPNGATVSNGAWSGYYDTYSHTSRGFAITDSGDIMVAATLWVQVPYEIGYVSFVQIARVGRDQPVILSVEDVPADQGKAVSIRHTWSYFEEQTPTVTHYDIYLRDDPLPGQLGIETTIPGWILVSSVAADGSATYDTTVPTLADSTIVGGLHESAYMVRAVTTDSLQYFASPIATGYSVNNLAPATPSNVAFSGGNISWVGGSEPDFDYFTVHASWFDVLDERAVFLTQTTESSLTIGLSPYPHYYVRAYDVAGNVSGTAHLTYVDEVVPLAPAQAKFDHPTNHFRWRQSYEVDFDHYVVYGSAFSTFDRPHDLLTVTTHTSYEYTDTTYCYLYVTAVDWAGNESAASLAEGLDCVPPPAPVIVAYYTSTGVLTWQMSPDPDFDHYVVYASDSDSFDDPKEQIQVTDEPEAAIPGIPQCYLFVTAVDWSGNESLGSRISRFDCPPGLPANLTYDWPSETLSWDASLEPDFDHYVAFGSMNDTFDQPKDTLAVTANNMLGVPGVPYHYFYVIVVDADGNESRPARFDRFDAVAPATPSNVQYDSGDSTLSWHAALEPDFDHYAVYGSQFAVFSQEHDTIATTADTTIVLSPASYCYVYVTTVDWSGNESLPTRFDVFDCVAPTAPANLSYDNDNLVLTWNPSPDADFDHFVVYGSGFDTFDQSHDSIGATVDTTLDVSSAPYLYYYAVTVDQAGNESPPSRVERLDQRAPERPATVAYDDGILMWDPSPDADVDHYTVYGSEFDSFDKEPRKAIAQTNATSLDVGATPFRYYYVTATDISGNESLPLGTGGWIPRVLAISAFPNPFNPETTIRYDVPRRGRVQINIYNVNGALVRRLEDVDRLPGTYTVRWSGEVESGTRAGSGVYFARIEAGGESKARKLVLLK